jgi:hypothetical protein
MTETATVFSTAWAMPSPWTFDIAPIAAFVGRHTRGCQAIVDPFAGRSRLAHYSNDLGRGGVDAEKYVRDLIARGVRADAVIFDPPYSARQISECYRGIGREVTMSDTQSGSLYRRVRAALSDILTDDGIALSFGWQSNGFGRSWETLEILLVQHGGAHNDTICVAQRRRDLPLFTALSTARRMTAT